MKKFLAVLGALVRGLMQVVITALFLGWSAAWAAGGDVYYLYQIYGDKVTDDMIDALFPKAFAISIVIWLALLVLYRRYLS